MIFLSFFIQRSIQNVHVLCGRLWGAVFKWYLNGIKTLAVMGNNTHRKGKQQTPRWRGAHVTKTYNKNIPTRMPVCDCGAFIGQQLSTISQQFFPLLFLLRREWECDKDTSLGDFDCQFANDHHSKATETQIEFFRIVYYDAYFADALCWFEFLWGTGKWLAGGPCCICRITT